MVIYSWSGSLFLFLLCLFGKGFRIDVKLQSQNFRNDVLEDIDEQLAVFTLELGLLFPVATLESKLGQLFNLLFRNIFFVSETCIGHIEE